MFRPTRERRWSRILQRTIGIALFAFVGWTGGAAAAPVTFNTALPVGVGDFVFREQFFFSRASRDPSPANRSVEAWGAVSVLGYGVTSDLTLFGILPYMNKRLDFTMGGSIFRRRTNGIGDASLFARYTIFQDNFPGGNFRIAPFAGVKAPTGASRTSDSLGRLPQPIQLGSGSWDFFGGVVTTYQTLDFQIDAQGSYKANTAANDFRFGDEVRLDASLQYRLWPRELGEGVPGFLYGVLETNLIYQGKNRIGGIADSDSGGTTLFLAPGLQYVTQRWIVEAIVQLPVVQDLNGTALKNNFNVLAGFRVNF